jgi:hypothetical protein
MRGVFVALRESVNLDPTAEEGDSYPLPSFVADELSAGNGAAAANSSCSVLDAVRMHIFWPIPSR